MANGVLGSLLILLKVRSDVKGITRANRELRNTDRIAKTVRNSLRLLSGLGLAFGGKQMISSYLEFEKSLGAVHSRFMAITKDSAKAEEQFNYARDTARGLGLDIFETANNYSLFFSGTAKQLGADGAQQVFDSWSKVSRVLHLTPYQMERITYALREMSSKGTVYSSDLRMQIGTHVPNAVENATKAIQNLGINGVKSIEDFQKASKGNIPLINRFIKEFSRLNEVEFASPEAIAEAMKQPDALLGIIKDFGWDFMVEFSKAGGNELVLNTLNGIIDVLKSTDFKGLVSALGTMAKIIGKLLTFLIRNIPVLISVIIGLITAMAFNSIAGVGGKFGRASGMLPINFSKMGFTGGLKQFLKMFMLGLRVTFRMVGKRIFVIALRLFRMLGGPTGLIVTAITAGIGILVTKIIPMINAWRDSLARVMKTPEQTDRVLGKLQPKIKRLQEAGFSEDEINRMLQKADAHVIIDGVKRQIRINREFKPIININNYGDNLNTDEIIDKMSKSITQVSKKEEAEDFLRTINGIYK